MAPTPAEKNDGASSPDPERTEKASPHVDAADGGTTAWLVVLGAWCVSFSSFGWLNSVGTFQQYYQTGPLSDYPPSTIAWIPSLQIFFMMAMGPIVGKLYDHYGPRYLLIGGTFLHVFGLMMASLADKYYQFLLAQGVCSAIGVAAIFQPAISVIPAWFQKKRGAAYGILSTGSSLGGVIFPIMLGRLIPSIGYGWSMRVAAFLILGLLTIAIVTIKSRHPPQPRGLSGSQMLQPFREPMFCFVLAGIFLVTFGIYVPITYLPVQAIAQGMPLNIVDYLIPMLNAGSLFGRLMAGLLGDRVGKYNIFALCCFLAAVFTLGLWIPGTSEGAIIAYAVLFGFFSGAYVTLIGALVAQISPLQEIGYRTGVVFLIASLPGLTTSPIAGAMFERTHDYNDLKVFAGVFIIAGTLSIVCARVKQTGFKLLAVY